jgi:hypothetical protein
MHMCPNKTLTKNISDLMQKYQSECPATDTKTSNSPDSEETETVDVGGSTSTATPTMGRETSTDLYMPTVTETFNGGNAAGNKNETLGYGNGAAKTVVGVRKVLLGAAFFGAMALVM